MDKETLSNYGWIVICVLVLAVMLALASPFGSFVAVGVKSTTQGLFDTNQKALNTTGLVNIDDQSFDDGTIPLGGVYTKKDGTVLSGNSNDSFPATPTTGDTYEYGDYIYKYNNYYSYTDCWYSWGGQNGWGVRVKDTTKSSYGEIISKIAGKPVNTMTGTFYKCTSLTTAPEIPDSVTNMSETFYYCKSLTTAPEIPSGVTNMGATFSGCTNLTTTPTIPNSVTIMYQTFENCTNLITAPTIPNGIVSINYTFLNCRSLITAPIIPDSVTDMYQTFRGCSSLTTAPTIPNSITNMNSTFEDCTSLTGTITINANPKYNYRCFSGTKNPITLTGTSTKLSNIASSYSNVTVATTP